MVGIRLSLKSTARIQSGLLLAEWGLLLAAIGIWLSAKTYHPRMTFGGALLVGAWAIRWVRAGQLTRRTPLDVPLVLFLLSALVGLWAAPSAEAAYVRLYLFVGAVGVFYQLANSEATELGYFADGLSIFAAILGVYFATQHDWGVANAKLAIVGQLGQWFNLHVPDLGLYKPHPNVVASLLAIVIPIGWMRWKTYFGEARQAREGGFRVGATLTFFTLNLLVILFGLLMTESRGSGLALAGATGLAIWWKLAPKVETPGSKSKKGVFWAGVALVALTAGGVIVARPQWLTKFFGALPGPNSAISRIDVYAQAWRLAEEKPFTGGGLDSFPALYSSYVLVVPQLFLTHAHNAYLNVLVEQGWPGLIGYAGMLLGAAWVAVQALYQPHVDNRLHSYAMAGALGIVVVALQSFVDGTLVASRVIPALLIPAGLVLAGTSPARPRAISRATRFVSLGAAALLFIAALVAWRPLLAAWHANLGAVTYDRIALVHWPTDQWDDGHNAGLLARAEPELRRTLELDPDNATANYRLGLAADLHRDFAAAAEYLQRAHAADLGHRGITKALGFAYTWLGEYRRAAELLVQIPEARDELQVYVWWWGAQGRDELSRNAQKMAAKLGQ